MKIHFSCCITLLLLLFNLNIQAQDVPESVLKVAREGNLKYIEAAAVAYSGGNGTGLIQPWQKEVYPDMEKAAFWFRKHFNAEKKQRDGRTFTGMSYDLSTILNYLISEYGSGNDIDHPRRRTVPLDSKKSLFWLNFLIELDPEDMPAKHLLAEYTLEGRGIPKDVNRAISMYKRLNTFKANEILATIYLEGANGILPDEQQALVHLINIKSYTTIGNIYRQGKGNVPANTMKAIEYFQLAKEYRLIAEIYESGEGIASKDIDKSLLFYEKAVAEKDTLAVENLVRWYSSDDPVKRDIPKFVKYYSLLKEKDKDVCKLSELVGSTLKEGDPVVLGELKKSINKIWWNFESMYQMECLNVADIQYFYALQKAGIVDEVDKSGKYLGDVTKESTNSSLMFIEELIEAANHGHPGAKHFLLDQMIRYNSLTANRDSYPFEEIVRFLMTFKEADYKDESVMALYYFMLRFYGVFSNEKLTEYCEFLPLLEGESEYVSMLIGIIHVFGECEEYKQDFEKGIEILQPFAEKGNPLAQLYMGLAYEPDRLNDINKCVTWYKKAISEYPEIGLRLGDIYYYGNGVKKDLKEAYSYYQLGTENGHPDCACSLARMLVEGEGVKKDKDLAAEILVHYLNDLPCEDYFYEKKLDKRVEVEERKSIVPSYY